MIRRRPGTVHALRARRRKRIARGVVMADGPGEQRCRNCGRVRPESLMHRDNRADWPRNHECAGLCPARARVA